MDRWYPTAAEIRAASMWKTPRSSVRVKPVTVPASRAQVRMPPGEAVLTRMVSMADFLALAAGGPLHLYTDGSYSPGDGMGAAWVLADGENVLLTGHAWLGHGGDSGKAEIMAATMGLSTIPPGCLLVLRTDLERLVKVLSPPLAEWADPHLTGFVRAAALHREVEPEWVRGHSGIPLNVMADRMARKARRAGESGHRAPTPGAPREANCTGMLNDVSSSM